MKSYAHLEIAEGITVSIPDTLNTYEPKAVVFAENENDPNVKRA